MEMSGVTPQPTHFILGMSKILKTHNQIGTRGRKELFSTSFRTEWEIRLRVFPDKQIVPCYFTELSNYILLMISYHFVATNTRNDKMAAMTKFGSIFNLCLLSVSHFGW